MLDFIEAPEDIAAGDQIITSGDDGIFPPGLLVGQVVETNDRLLRARLAADMARLRFLRVMRSHPGTSLADPGALIGPPWPPPEGFVLPPDASSALRPGPRPDARLGLSREGTLE
jgi:rod shape-determining protein MreC